ncbi:hypothetical protein HZA99_04500 [Candidatus Woesearchaeota archaeon]|nr:hypothetical protein [Candidatus Woesearchaeota archaeon]
MTEEHLPAKYLFWITFAILLIITFLAIKTKYADEKEFEMYARQAAAQNNPFLCENIKNLRLSSQCYMPFVENGFDCTKQIATNSSSACLIAQGVYLQDDFFCDAVLTGTNVPENLECRVSVFIQRYTNEGLSDCCHIR